MRATARGRVQGVGFRYFVVDQARRLGLRGWVRNTARGDVELLAEGAAGDVQALLDAVRKGPPRAWVQELAVEDEQYRGDLEVFATRSTSW